MKTNREQQPASVPPAGEDKQAGEDLWQRYGAEREAWTKNMLTALDKGVKGNKWFSLIDKIASERTLAIAWEKVRSNAGACGVDGITVGTFAKDSEERLLAVKEHIKKGTYLPKAIKRVHIPKPGSSEKRPLGIPTVTDRVVQTAVKKVIEPIFERGFAPSSYGFRLGRGCKDALREVERHLRKGKSHVVDVDIKGYFDNIPHAKLMELVRERIADGRVLDMLKKFLKAGVLEEGVITDPATGSPQGGIVSPLLANIYLDPLDKLLESLGLNSVRYADDIVVLAENAEAARQALRTLEEWMEVAELTLHPEKTRIVDMNEADAHFDFLGYRFKRSRKGKLLKLVRPKSAQNLRSKLKKPTKRSNGQSMEAIIEAINPILRGWYEYFKHVHPSEMNPLDSWVRMRLRSILRKRRKRKGRGCGLDHYRWPNHYFANLGLFSLQAAREEEVNLRIGAKC
jgi:RNA-directed DNA polymerase